MRSARRLLGVGALTAGVVAGLAAGPIPQASAAPTVNTFQIPLVTPNSIWSCGLSLYCTYPVTAITGEAPGTVTFPVRSPGAHINWTYRMAWRNLGTGASGVLTVPYSQSVSVFTGAGLVTASMTNGSETIAGTGVFFVP
ncbi:hypothetical protein [Prescottella agglutinans]|uniref:Uncharacterized protein n=1 Tax=Prescottella agglutinans TaxID=1644129 RepID=A0ABT6MLG1_9NOCA|nr:hypothetical protein [Prescottella agglutinans]MDH6284214.1 hypothetical protein [Prescottella agglutinans]